MDNKKTIQTSDMGLAVFLKAHGFQINNVTGHTSRLVFHFDGIPEELTAKYALGRDPVSLTIQAFNEMKQIIRRSVARY